MGASNYTSLHRGSLLLGYLPLQIHQPLEGENDHARHAGCARDEGSVHHNVVGRTERGKYNPSVMTLDAIAAALNTSMVDLLRGTRNCLEKGKSIGSAGPFFAGDELAHHLQILITRRTGGVDYSPGGAIKTAPGELYADG
jgi:transcriptional regulator with XRE-family HTH domain